MIRKIVKEHEFWVSNISDKNCSLTDLGLTIPARKNVNLLDSRHYSLTREQLELSALSGSLYKKRDKLKVRQVSPPELLVKPGIHTTNMPLHMAKSGFRSAVVVKDEKYEELDFTSEEKFAQDIVDDELNNK